ncbi:MAG: hypothetical protein OXF52_05845 [Candidatus Dadabacteria bacterium]|nr:hypothetical protein [Candidatus Dadabacteria bacterium]MCY4042981.1 hypothetical protein [Candidatus Dadabacteria bacterium]
MLTAKTLKKSLSEKRSEIRKKLAGFRRVIKHADDAEIFEELAFCIFTAGASARMGLKSIAAVRPVIMSARSEKQFSRLLKKNGAHRFPNERARYLLHTRNYLRDTHGMEMRRLIMSFDDPDKRRAFFAETPDIKGIGFKEASHFLRNIGLGGYAILDKHIMNCLFEMGVVDDPAPPARGKRYLEIEGALRRYAKRHGFDMDEMDLLLWSEKTGAILK